MFEIDNESNIPEITVSKLEHRLLTLISNVVKRGEKISSLPSVILWGVMGVGKSDGVKQLAADLSEKTGKKVNLVDIRLLLFSPVDLRGLPTVNQDRTAAVWLVPEIFRLDGSDDVINIVFLDEISACTPSVQAAAYQIVLDHKVGEHTLPDNTFVIAAGNRTCDKSVAYKMPKALANRFCHFEISTDVDEWCEWALRHNIDHRIIGYIRFRNDKLLMPEVEDDDLAFPTPRSWEMASKYIEMFGGDTNAAHYFIRGCVGNTVSADFSSYCSAYSYLPDIKKIFSVEIRTAARKSPDICHAYVSSMISYVRNHPTDYSGIDKSIGFAADNFPVDFVFLLIQGYSSSVEGLLAVMKNMQSVRTFIQKKGGFLNGIV